MTYRVLLEFTNRSEAIEWLRANADGDFVELNPGCWARVVGGVRSRLDDETDVGDAP